MERNKTSVSLWKLYRYADCLDTVVLLLATCCSTLAGVCFPLLLLIYGSAFTQFANYAVTIQLEKDNLSSADYFCNDSTQTNLREYLNSNDTGDKLRSEIPTFTYYTLGVAVFYFLFTSVSRFLWCVSAARQGRRIRLAYLKSVLTRHVGWFDINSSTELHTHLSNGVQIIETGIGYSMSRVVQDFSLFISSLVFAFVVNWKLTSVITTLIPVIFIIAFYVIQKIFVTAGIKKQNALAMTGSVAEEVLSSIKTVKAFSGHIKEAERYHFHLKQVKRESYKIVIAQSLLYGNYSTVLFFGNVIAAVISVGTVTIIDVLPYFGSVFGAVASASIIYKIIDTKSEINSSSNVGIIPDECEGNILFSDVEFRYPSRPDVEILHGLDISIKSGQTVALVGPSGCGKSTIVKLIPRIYEYIGGIISLDGIDIRDLNISWLRNQIGIVSQEPVLFNVSVAENISYGKEGATMREIVLAAKVANAHDFISSLPDGYNTVVGEGGAQLSGGQKQRIAIARVLVRDPKILLLDEATSALDTESEKYVQKALDNAREGRTTIIIAHRLSTIQTADIIIGIDKGYVVEMGSHNELMKSEGLYYKLVMNQMITEEEEKGKDTMFWAEVNEQSSAILSKPIQYSSTELAMHREVLHQDTELMDITEVSTEKIPLLEKKLTPTYTQRNQYLFTAMNEVFKLCFRKIHWVFLIVGVVTFTGLGITFPVNNIFYLGVAENLIKTDSEEVISGSSVYLIIAATWGVALFAFAFSSLLFFGICEHQITEKVRLNFFKAMLNKDISWFDQPENCVSMLIHKLAVEATNISYIMSVHVGVSIKDAVAIVISVILTFVLAWPIALILAPAFPLILLGGYVQVMLTKRYTDRRNKLIEDTAKVAVESIDNVFTVATLGIEKRIVCKYNRLLEQPFRYSLKSAAVNSVIYGCSISVVSFIAGFVYIVGAYAITSEESKVYYADYAEIFIAITLTLSTSILSKKQCDALPDLQIAFLSAKRFIMMTSTQPVIDDFSGGGIIPEEVKGSLKMEDIKFIYPARPGVTVLQSFDTSVSPGKTLALVGPSGSGKSTVISLIERFYDPTAGCVLFDGTDIRDLNISWYRHQIGLVSQEPILFNISIADNIRYGANFREVSDEEVIQAARSANIHEFIQSLPQGYQTRVGLKGTQLSGGQKQRVAIARALIRDPKILLLDEATSALDTENENVVHEALEKAREGRTTIIIAHRLSTIYSSDSIAVLYNGQVIEQGTHSELIDQHGTYYLMNNVQKLRN